MAGLRTLVAGGKTGAAVFFARHTDFSQKEALAVRGFQIL
jgi:hypothetical protein